MSLTDAQWARIEPLLPDRPTPRRGGWWGDQRQVIDAIVCKYRAGTPWMDCPSIRVVERYPQPPAHVGRGRDLGEGLHRPARPSRRRG
ncbi:transposase [Streptomyces sp. NPDC058646]|uniref:transposase n=1 Tax=Streptomyces sp. NPDC058646 TaxID=3346574 RepID=UPI00364DCCBA